MSLTNEKKNSGSSRKKKKKERRKRRGRRRRRRRGGRDEEEGKKEEEEQEEEQATAVATRSNSKNAASKEEDEDACAKGACNKCPKYSCRMPTRGEECTVPGQVESSVHSKNSSFFTPIYSPLLHTLHFSSNYYIKHTHTHLLSLYPCTVSNVNF